MVSPLLLLVGALLIVGCGSSSPSRSTASSSVPGSAASSSAAASPTTSTTASAPAPGGKPTLITTKHSKLGTILAAGPKELTVYLFEADKGPHSTCAGACAAAWPPVLGTARADGGAMSADLGTITRPDGQTQVSYNGHPLYYFVKDKDHEDAYGQGSTAFGADWYVLAPSGTKIDEDSGAKS
jgi:predicted lipoprotein with Yx(FWY)xxD motif